MWRGSLCLLAFLDSSQRCEAGVVFSSSAAASTGAVNPEFASAQRNISSLPTCPAFSGQTDLTMAKYACNCTDDVHGGLGGCDAITPRFNWIIGTCLSYSKDKHNPNKTGTPFPLYSPDAMFCDRPQRDTGSNSSAVELYYIASYQYEHNGSAIREGPRESPPGSNVSGHWRMLKDSSFNTDHRKPLVNLTALVKGGGAQYWDHAHYPTNSKGVGPPGMLFVISCKQCSRFTWFMLNQGTLDRGPAVPTCDSTDACGTPHNCWSTSSSGEIDFLETGFWNNDTYEVAPNRNNSRHYVTSYNGGGLCFPTNNGFGAASGLPAKASGGLCSTAYFVDDGEEHIYAAVVDRRGTTVYRDPSWPGIEKFIASVHPADAPLKPDKLGGPCDVFPRSCAVTNPSCLQQPPYPKNFTGGNITCGAKSPVTRATLAAELAQEQAALQAPPPPVFCCNKTLGRTDANHTGCFEWMPGVLCPDGNGSTSLADCRQHCDGGPAPKPPAPPPGPPPKNSTVFCCKDLTNAEHWKRIGLGRGPGNSSNSSGGCFNWWPGLLCPDGKGSTSLPDCQNVCVPSGPPPPPVFCCNSTGNASYSSKCVPWPPGQLCPDGTGSTDTCSCNVKCAGKPANATVCPNNWWDLFVDTGQWAAAEPGWDCATFKSYSDPGRLDRQNACYNQLCWAAPSDY